MRRPITGTLVLLVGVMDVVLSAVLYADQLADIGAAGVVGAVMFGERAGPEAAALWFAVKGVLLIVVGQLARAYEKLDRALPAAPGWLLAALGLVGGIIAPISGFWVYLALGALWIWESRAHAG
jgi:uncharacterized protein DUF6463